MLFCLNQGLNGILADEMGLGKTIQAMAFLGHLAEVRLCLHHVGFTSLVRTRVLRLENKRQVPSDGGGLRVPWCAGKEYLGTFPGGCTSLCSE